MLLRIFICISVILSQISFAYALEITAGEWELTVKQSVKGMPTGISTQKYRECFTDDDPIPTSFLKARQCDVIEQRVRHRTVYYRINCFTENGSIINEGKVRFGTFEISGKSKTSLGEIAGRDMIVRYKFKARRIGECTLKR